MKTVAIVVRSSPFNSIRFAEALRIGVGQILSDNQVNIFLLGEGAWNAVEIHPAHIGRPDISESLALLGPCKIHLYADAESLKGKATQRLNKQVEVLSKTETWNRIMESDVVMSF